MGKLDDVDMRILSALYADASVSIPRLSKELALNLSVTYSRIKRLSRRGIIQQSTIIVDESRLGFPASAVVGVNLDPKQRAQALDQISKMDMVRRVTEVTGRFDLFVELRGRNIEEIQRAVSEVIGKIPGVNQTETFIEVSQKRPGVAFRMIA